MYYGIGAWAMVPVEFVANISPITLLPSIVASLLKDSIWSKNIALAFQDSRRLCLR